MSQDGGASEKSAAPVALAAHEDARQLVRLLQCTQCSKPFRNPVTLPCGSALCKECLPEAHERENISYPDIPGRRHGIKCPFTDCEVEHPASDCNVDVILAKVMESISELVAKHSSLVQGAPMLKKDDLRYDEIMSSQPSSDEPHVLEYSGARLVATFVIAAQGQLPYNDEVKYLSRSGDDNSRALDVAFLEEVLEATHKETDCQVCYATILDPVTTFCGHTLCRKCMARVLDHSLHCPVCRRALAIPPSLLKQPSNKALVNLLNGMCPDVIAMRVEAVALEEQPDGHINIPLFVCTLGFPHQPTFLRIFEPRYRLMLRRCLEGNRRFGMLMYNRYNEPQGELGNVHFYQYGTMLEIVHAQVLADGTSLIETRGLFRFRVTGHGVHDGYAIGNVERLDDVNLAEEERIEAEETAKMPDVDQEDSTGQVDHISTKDLLALSRDFVTKMQGRSAVWLQQKVLDVHGQPPEDAALFPYWFASVLPISDEEKYKLLGTRTVRERLKITANWIRRIETQRWYTYLEMED